MITYVDCYCCSKVLLLPQCSRFQLNSRTQQQHNKHNSLAYPFLIAALNCAPAAAWCWKVRQAVSRSSGPQHYTLNLSYVTAAAG
jgi:hypothetical protein